MTAVLRRPLSHQTGRTAQQPSLKTYANTLKTALVHIAETLKKKLVRQQSVGESCTPQCTGAMPQCAGALGGLSVN